MNTTPKSKLYLSEAVPNSQRKTNGAKEYYPCIVHMGTSQVPALFSMGQISVATNRAALQPEDAPVTLDEMTDYTYTGLQKWYIKFLTFLRHN